MGKHFGVVGYPITHSLSPIMHTEALKESQYGAVYRAYGIVPENFEHVMAQWKQENEVAGFNVTLPFKERIIAFCDEVEPFAQKLGAVNTVVCRDGKWIGYNTDGIGYVDSLIQSSHYIDDTKILVIGAGGAARGIVGALTRHTKQISICNRTKEKAETLLKEWHCKGSAYSLEEAAACLNEFQIVINTTNIGMEPNVDEMPIDLTNLKPTTIVSDIVYNPLYTKLLREAQKRGATIHTGVGMFINQGARAFKLWTGMKPPIQTMTNVVMKKLESD